MLFAERLKLPNASRILLFYGIVLLGTYLARKAPNLLRLGLEQVTDIPFSFNYNHGLVTLLAALLFYQFTPVKQEITLLGNKKRRALLFPLVLFGAYSLYGIGNEHGVDEHAWAFLICFFALVYNIMEEYAWRGYLVDALQTTPFIAKALVSGVFWSVWHLLVFSDFDQYGGFWIFLAFCLIFSFLLTFAVTRTKSILVAASLHAFIIQTNDVALICLVVFALLLLTWNKNTTSLRKVVH